MIDGVEPTPRIRNLEKPDIPRCEAILRGLPEWFGLPESNRSNIEGLSHLPSAVAECDGQVVGFVSLRMHYEQSVEIEVLAIDRDLHHRGVGQRLVDWALQWCRTRGAGWLHVKTRGPSTPDPFYEKTRRFYFAVGFEPLFESNTLWGPEDAALILIRRVEQEESRRPGETLGEGHE